LNLFVLWDEHIKELALIAGGASALHGGMIAINKPSARILSPALSLCPKNCFIYGYK